MSKATRRESETTRRLAAALRSLAPGGRSRGLGGPTRGPTARLLAEVRRRARSAAPDRRRGRTSARSRSRRRNRRRGRSGDRTDELAAAASEAAVDNAVDYLLLVVGLRLVLSGLILTFVSSNLLVVALVNLLLFGPLVYRHLGADDRSRRPRGRRSSLSRLRARLAGDGSVERL